MNSSAQKWKCVVHFLTFRPSKILTWMKENHINLELINYQVSNIHLKYYSDIVTHFIKSSVPPSPCGFLLGLTFVWVGFSFAQRGCWLWRRVWSVLFWVASWRRCLQTWLAHIQVWITHTRALWEKTEREKVRNRESEA